MMEKVLNAVEGRVRTEWLHVRRIGSFSLGKGENGSAS